MAFQAMLSGAECSTGNNALSQLLKHTGGDRSLQQGDRTTAGPSFQGVGPSSMRQMNGGGGGAGNDAEAFFRQQQAQHAFAQQQSGGAGAFDFEQMKGEMNRINGGPNGWAEEMARRSAPGQGPNVLPPEMLRQLGGSGPGMADMEAAFARNAAANDGAAQAWRQQFPNYSPQASANIPAGHASSGNNSMPYSSRMAYGGGGMGMMAGSGGMSYMSTRAPLAASSQKGKESSRFVELDDAKWEEQFAKLDEADVKADASKGKGKASDELPSEEEQNASIRAALDDLEKDVQADGIEAQTRFEELWNSMNSGNAADVDLAEWEKELSEARQRVQDEMYTHPGGGIGLGDAARNEMGGLDGTEDALMEGYGMLSSEGYPRLGKYRFDQRNPYINHPDPLSEGLRLLGNGGSLADASLLFEVATQRDPATGTGGEQNEVDAKRRYRSEAWRRLGEAQAMNERETQAIRALEEAIKVDDGNLEAYMALGIAYTNEGYDSAAHKTLERYITQAYPHLKPEPLPASISGIRDPLEGTQYANEESNPWATLNRVTSLFLQAAREGNASGRIDPEVQVGLGVLFYSNSSYDQARDCFETALKERPNDFLLWNRLGATLANGGKPEDAIQAYHKALELRPTFTRAIYNLSVSCLNLGAHHEAAEHLLSALALQQNSDLPDIPPEIGGGDGINGNLPPLAEARESSNLWSTLRRIFLAMDRGDLAQTAHVGSDLNQFRQQGFEF
jgi:peroxin-5